MQRWKSSVIHLETAEDSVSATEMMEQWEHLAERIREGTMSLEEAAQVGLKGSRDIRCHGSALFMRENARRYLITARHVLSDERASQKRFDEEVIRRTSFPPEVAEALRAEAGPRATDEIFNLIFRVPSLEEVKACGLHFRPKFLMNLGAGTRDSHSWVFSDAQIDLAAVSLDVRDSAFADELEQNGYDALPLDALAIGPSGEGAEVFTIGYPSTTSLLAELNNAPALAQWSASYLSLPTFSFGRVGMTHADLPFFWADMTIYGGNSGGPVIEGDRVVGFVSEQPILPTEGVDRGIHYRVPFCRAIKAVFVRDLITTLQERESRRRRLL